MGKSELNWTDFQAAFHVGRLGTLSAAADFLGVHRATVQRHIDALEKSIGAKLFHRHTKGYTPTEIGRELMRASAATQDQFTQIAGMAKKQEQELSGDFVITSVDVTMPVISPLIGKFLETHPNLSIDLVASSRLLKMEYGEAHVAFRLGSKPKEPDSVVQYFTELEFGLYASPAYAQQYGIPQTVEACREHRFVRFNGPNQHHSWHQWLNENIPNECTVFRSRSTTTLDHALIGGNGIGLFPLSLVDRYPDLVPVLADVARWREVLWLVTHVDLHRGAKVQAFLETLKAAGYLMPTGPAKRPSDATSPNPEAAKPENSSSS